MLGCLVLAGSSTAPGFGQASHDGGCLQMGDPTGTGRGGESAWGGKFEDGQCSQSPLLPEYAAEVDTELGLQRSRRRCITQALAS